MYQLLYACASVVLYIHTKLASPPNAIFVIGKRQNNMYYLPEYRGGVFLTDFPATHTHSRARNRAFNMFNMLTCHPGSHLYER